MSGIHRSHVRPKGGQREGKDIKKIVWGTLITLLLGVALWVTHSSSFLIKSVSVSGAKSIDASLVRAITEESIQGSYIYLFPRSNSFLYPKRKIPTRLIKEEPRIEEVTVKVPLDNLTTLEVALVERESKLVWCVREDSCALLDEDGVIYASAPLDKDSFFIISKEGDDMKPFGSVVIDPKELASLFIIETALQGDIDIVKAVILPEGDYALISVGGAQVLFNKDDNLDIIISNLYTLFRSDIIKGEGGSGTSTVATWLSGIDYVDARFGKKIFYKKR